MKTKGLLASLLLTALCAAILVTGCNDRESPSSAPAPVEKSGEDIPAAPAPAESNMPPGARQVIREWTPAERPGLEPELPGKKRISGVDPQTLRKYEGSYTTKEIRSGSGRSASVPLDSKWIHKGSNSPQIRMTIGKNPVTGEYEPVGGEVGLCSGVGMSYEEDSRTGEQKSFLKLKKEF